MKLKTALLGAVGSIAILGIALAQQPGVNSNVNTVFNMVYEASTIKPTYSSTSIFVPAAAAQDVCTLRGSATKTVKVRRILLAGINRDAQSDPVGIYKRSTANTLGTASVLTKVPYDSQYGAATAVAESYTANATGVGTAVGALADVYLNWSNLTTTLGDQQIIEFGRFGSAAVLRGVAQAIAVNLSGLTYTTPQLSCTIEWTEE